MLSDCSCRRHWRGGEYTTNHQGHEASASSPHAPERSPFPLLTVPRKSTGEHDANADDEREQAKEQ